MVNGPAVVSVFTIETSAEGRAVSPAVALLFEGSRSVTVVDAVAVLLNAPAALIVAVTVTLSVSVADRFGGTGVQGNDEQPEPVTLVMVRLVGVSLMDTAKAASGPAL